MKLSEDDNATVVVDVYPTKRNVEVVGWRKTDDKGIEKLKRQAEREDGQLLILSPDNGSAAALSALPLADSGIMSNSAAPVKGKNSQGGFRASIADEKWAEKMNKAEGLENAESIIRYSTAIKNAWGENFPNVMVQTTLHSVKEKYGDLHTAAKAGDAPSAAELIEKIVKPEKVKALAARHPNAIVTYVHAEEATGRNKIPSLYAAYIHNQTGLDIEPRIVQTVRANHTGASANDRLTRDAQFDGPVEAGREYILIDDHVTMGTTLNELRNYIENNGGKVVEISVEYPQISMPFRI